MHWTNNYQLFLFDFDGLLVNTEKMHFQAYHNICAARHIELEWTFSDFYQIAHYHSSGLSDYLYTHYPKLRSQEPSWDILYQEKKQEFLKLSNAGFVELMPGVEKILKFLQASNIPRCVVTHSSEQLVSNIRDKIPCLQTIPHWITREDYHQAKPHPECYIKAIHDFGKQAAKVIGFEDSPRGLTALMHTKATPVLISEIYYPEIPQFITKGAYHYPSFNHIDF